MPTAASAYRAFTRESRGNSEIRPFVFRAGEFLTARHAFRTPQGSRFLTREPELGRLTKMVPVLSIHAFDSPHGEQRSSLII